LHAYATLRIHRPTRLLLACALAAAAPALSAQGGAVSDAPPELQDVPEPPPLPERVRSGEALEPDVRIVRREGATVTEYRVNGRLRAIKVQPDGDFPPYFLFDTDGNGTLESRRNRFDPDLLIPHWVIFSW
jgi:hypothetical protein